MKRITNPTLEQLLAIPHGTEVKVSINDVVCDAIVNTEEWKGKIFFCQDFINGGECKEKLGKKFSWFVGFGRTGIDWVKTYDTLESYCTPEDEPIIDLIEGVMELIDEMFELNDCVELFYEEQSGADL